MLATKETAGQKQMVSIACNINTIKRNSNQVVPVLSSVVIGSGGGYMSHEVEDTCLMRRRIHPLAVALFSVPVLSSAVILLASDSLSLSPLP